MTSAALPIGFTGSASALCVQAGLRRLSLRRRPALPGGPYDYTAEDPPYSDNGTFGRGPEMAAGFGHSAARSPARRSSRRFLAAAARRVAAGRHFEVPRRDAGPRPTRGVGHASNFISEVVGRALLHTGSTCRSEDGGMAASALPLQPAVLGSVDGHDAQHLPGNHGSQPPSLPVFVSSGQHSEHNGGGPGRLESRAPPDGPSRSASSMRGSSVEVH